MSIDFLEDLNPIQREAATSVAKNLLIIAGAGSGKTRVLVHRIAWLLASGLDFNNILAVTFTNKAANEMRTRLESMLGKGLTSMWSGTFHGISNRLLRQHWKEAGLAKSFQIIDADDQLKLLRDIHRTLSLDMDRWPPKQSLSYINNKKEKAIRSNVVECENIFEATLIRVYKTYESICADRNLVDFAELILRSYELMCTNISLGDKYRERFRYILIDEFQDINTIQYLWVKSLYGDDSSLTVVGDDDQSIYGWRGADSGNMKRLTNDYSDFEVIRLEQNYRSTANILEAANAVITNNGSRFAKKLWTKADSGDPIIVYAAFNEIDEARYLVSKVVSLGSQGIGLNDMVILYRSNAQSRIFEEKLLEQGVSYRIYGGIRFFERAEIKDVLAYLRLAVNQEDDVSFARIVNFPSRGIGEATLVVLQDYAKTKNISLWCAAQEMISVNLLSSRIHGVLEYFVTLVNEIGAQIDELDLAAIISFVINFIGLREHYSKPQYGESRQSRLENLDELITAAQQFLAMVTNEGNRSNLQTFLAYVSLEAGERIAKDDKANVNLMTLHAAKGLEFKVVFLCGMEEGLFPHVMSMKNNDDLEEERRLCYVGMTRAKEKLYLSYAESRQIRGVSSFCKPSRFLDEIPKKLIKMDRIKKVPSFTSSKFKSILEGSMDNGEFSLGQKVFHDIFGEGVIIGFEGQGEYMLVRVNFKNYGSKLLSSKYAKLRI